MTVPAESWYLLLKAFAMITGLTGAALTAASRGHVLAGFVAFLISSVIWVYVAWRQREWSLLVLQFGFVIVDVIGICTWA